MKPSLLNSYSIPEFRFTFIFGLLSFVFYQGISQVPQGFNYQAIARDGSGNPVVNATISVRLSILSDSTGFYPAGLGTYVWEETHSNIKTNAFGLFNVVLGNPLALKFQGNAASFSDISWTPGPLYIGTKIFYPGTWKPMGAAQLWTVPYSMVAGDLSGAVKKLAVTGTTANMDEALFEVKNKTGQTVFAVYNEGVRVYVDDGLAKGTKGGFAIGGFGTGKAASQPYFVVAPDSIRAYIGTNPVKGQKGGFAIGGFNGAKAPGEEYLRVSRDSTRVYVREPAKGQKGGFAIGGFSAAKAQSSNFMELTPSNYFIGQEAGKSITTGLYNSFMGFQNGYSNTAGSRNIFLGYQSGYNNVSGNNNIFEGYQAGYSNNTGYDNVFMGNVSGNKNTTGFVNVGIGTGALYSNLVGFYDVAIGNMAGYFNTGSWNVYMGNYAGYENKTGWSDIFIGNMAGIHCSADENVFIGNSSGSSDTTGRYNTFVGNYSGVWNSRGENNSLFGYHAGHDNKSGSNSIYFGAFSGYKSLGSNNTLLGTSSGYNLVSGSNNVFLGYQAGYSELGSNRLHIANNSSTTLIYGEFDNNLVRINGDLYAKTTLINSSIEVNTNSTGNRNAYIDFHGDDTYSDFGLRILRGNGGPNSYSSIVHRGTGEFNIGANEAGFLTFSTSAVERLRISAAGGVGIGTNSPAARLDVLGGNWNVAGASEGDFRIGDANYRLKIGVATAGGGAGDVRVNAMGGLSRILFGGNGADVLIVTSTSVVPAGDNVIPLGASGNRWTSVYAANGTINTSDARLKNNIQDLGYGLESIMNLTPVSFTWKDDRQNVKRLGLIAQDVEKVISEVVDKGNDPAKTLGINYSELVPVLIKGIQEQQKQIETARQDNLELKKEVQLLKESLEQVKASLQINGGK